MSHLSSLLLFGESVKSPDPSAIKTAGKCEQAVLPNIGAMGVSRSQARGRAEIIPKILSTTLSFIPEKCPYHSIFQSKGNLFFSIILIFKALPNGKKKHPYLTIIFGAPFLLINPKVLDCYINNISINSST